MQITEEAYLEHHGVKGMHWGIRRDPAPAQLSSHTARTAVTREVIANYNKMDNKTFFRRYGATKRQYAKRVQKHGDPYAVRASKIRNKKDREKALSSRSVAEAQQHEARRMGKVNTKATLAVYGGLALLGGAAYLASPQGHQAMMAKAAHAGDAYYKARNVVKPDVATLLKRGGNLRVSDISKNVIDVGLHGSRGLGAGMLGYN